MDSQKRQTVAVSTAYPGDFPLLLTFEKIRQLFQETDHRLFGAVAYLCAEQGSDRQAQNQRLFVSGHRR